MIKFKKAIYKSSAVILIISLLFVGCSNSGEDTLISSSTQSNSQAEATEISSTQTTQTQTVTWSWQKDTPENQGFDSSALDGLYSRFNSFDLLSCAIVKNERLIDEFYKDGYDENSAFVLHSASKSVTSALVGIAVDKGYIESVDVPVSEYFPDVDMFQGEWGSRITIYHLLNHTSGIATTDSSLWYDWRASDNWLEYVFALPLEAEPGASFNYSTGNTHILCAIVQQATGMTLYEFGNEFLFKPLGMNSVKCPEDAQGICDGGNGFEMTVHDMLKLGQLYINNGNWNGEQIICEDWINDSTSVQYDRSTGSADYGYQWWVRSFGDGGYDGYFAQGHGGQYIFVVPSLELVIAITSNYEGSTSVYWQIANEIVNACS